MLARAAFRFFSKLPLPGAKFGNSGLYAMFFTCNKCGTRAGKTFTKQAYHSGVVLIRCEGCDNLHLVADHLGWFRDNGTTIEDIMKEKGENIAKLNTDQQVLEFVGDTDETPQLN
mmetsp:Transcript_29361/g.52561  ORF Transcript_29361/g.52561 Transcript_29361/m.52561 type:complete len:115 (-) Transcript_29361:445-789(-)